MKFTKDRFKDQTVIVTGAGAGIGKACCIRFASEGARVIATDWNADRLESLKKELSDFSIATITGDISQESLVQKIVTAADGRVDVVINNAGIMDNFLPVTEVDDETWQKVFNINVTGPMRLMRATLPMMLKNKNGAIVNVSSEAGLRGACAGAAYTMSKHALIGLTRNTAFMYADQGIRVNAIAPGGVKTSIEATFNSELAAKRLGPVFESIATPMAEAEHLAAAITWLASDDSVNVNGAVLPSDGGWSVI